MLERKLNIRALTQHLSCSGAMYDTVVQMEDGSDLLLYVVKVTCWKNNTNEMIVLKFSISRWFAVSLLRYDSFEADSIHSVLLDQNKGSCASIETLAQKFPINQNEIVYKIRLKNRPDQTTPTVIGQIHIDILGKILITPL